MPELTPQHHSGDESVRTPIEERVRSVYDHGLVLTKCFDDPHGGFPEREELQLSGRIDENVLCLVFGDGIDESVDVDGKKVSRDDLCTVGSEVVLVHDLLEVDPFPDVDVRGVRDHVASRIEIHCDGIDAVVVEPFLVSMYQSTLAASGRSDEVDESHKSPDVVKG